MPPFAEAYHMQTISHEAARDILANAFNIRGGKKKPTDRERFMLKIAGRPVCPLSRTCVWH
jgi:hypothetical protein